MRVCPKCDGEITDDRRICRKCGSIVPEVDSAVTAESAMAAEVISESNDRPVREGESQPSTDSISIDLETSQGQVAGGGIWTCPKCASPVTHEFAVCWNCGTTRDGVEDPSFAALVAKEDKSDLREAPGTDHSSKAHGWHGRATSGSAETCLRVSFKHFHSTLASWEKLSRQAADFATEIGPERLISISHSEDGNDGVVIVWYWV
jgi:hypothetical protein